MKVADIMICNPAVCHRKTNLLEATTLMCQHNCGALPILDEHESVIGLITDRDICMVLGTRNQRATEVTVGEIATSKHFTCDPQDDIHVALHSMYRNRVRRLPVVDGDGHLKGILSIDDIVVNAQWSETHEVDLNFSDVIRVLKRITYPAKPCAAYLSEAGHSKR